MNPHQRCLQAEVKHLNEPKQVMRKSQDLSRSLEIKRGIWTFDTEFPTISINHAHILLSSLQFKRLLSYGYPRGQTVHLTEAISNL